MKEGLWWFDETKSDNISAQVRKAAGRFRTRFGQEPTACYIHQDSLNGLSEVDGIELRPSAVVFLYNYWIGVAEQ